MRDSRAPSYWVTPRLFLPLLCVTSNHLSHLLTVFLHIHRFIRTPASMVSFSEQKGEIGNKLLNKSIVSRHQIKSSALVVFLHIHIFIRISIILGNGASCPKITQPHFTVYFISPPIICHTRSPYSYIFNGTFLREGGRMVKIAQKLPDAHFPSFVAGVRSTLSPGLKCQQQL